MNKTIYFIIMILSMSLLCSCGKDEPQDNIDNSNGNGVVDKNIQKIVESNVSVNSSFSDYISKFTITSRVKSELSGGYIQYGIGHRSKGNQAQVAISIGAQAYSYSVKTYGNTETITIENPFWYYYAFVGKDSKKLSECTTYYNSYVALKNRGYNSLNPSEKELYNDITSILNDYLREVKSKYVQSIEVIYDNKYYTVDTYMIP